MFILFSGNIVIIFHSKVSILPFVLSIVLFIFLLAIYVLFVFSFMYEVYSQKSSLVRSVCLLIVIGYTVLVKVIFYDRLLVIPDIIF